MIENSPSKSIPDSRVCKGTPLNTNPFATAVFNSLKSQIAVLDADGLILTTNPAWRNFDHLDNLNNDLDWIGVSYLHVCDTAAKAGISEASAAAEGIRAVLRGETDEFQQDYPCHTPVARRWFSMRVTRLAEAGEARIVVSHEDISKLKLAEEKLRQLNTLATQSTLVIAERARFISAIADGLPALVAYWDKDLLCQFANSAYLEWFGKSPESLIGKITLRNLLGEHLFSLNEPYIRAALSGKKQNFERALIKADGSTGYVLADYIPDIDDNGTVVGFYVLVADITSIKKSEADLLLAASVFENASEGIMVANTDRVILSVNPAFSKITGYQALEAIGQKLYMFKADATDQAFLDAVWSEVTASGHWQGEVLSRTKNGNLYPAQVSITTVWSKDGDIINYVATLTDITQHKMLEQQRIADEAAHRDTLVREVHHRIKNNLQGVTGILRNFSTQHPETLTAINTAISQVQSIAVIHGLQGRITQNKIRLCELVGAIADNNKSIWQTAIDIDIPQAWNPSLITESEAVPIALVLNELISNALKHGDNTKAIRITLRYDPLSTTISVTITNQGRLSNNEDVDTSPIAGTGLQLVASLLPRKGASLTWQQNEGYVSARLMFTSPIITLEQPETERL